MTPLARRQLLQALHPHYRSASKAERTRLLDAFTKATGHNRKYAIGLLRQGPSPAESLLRPRWVRYDDPVVADLRRLWEASNYLCSKRLHLFLPSLIAALERCDELHLDSTSKRRLLQMSPATIDRKLAPYRRRLKPKGLTTTRPGSLLKRHIPIRTFTQWDEQRPGFTEMDLVAHCGESAHGEFIQTLSLVDIASGWFEACAARNRSQKAVFAALTTIRDRLPFPLLGVDSDNDTAFINDHLLRYCRQEHLTFTRSRDWIKNDQAHVEEKNGSVIRRLIGYDRFEGPHAADAFNALYATLHLWINFFQPSMKLIAKERRGAKVTKRYAPARTPYQRVLDNPNVSKERKQRLRQLYRTLNPVHLRDELYSQLDALWNLAYRSGLPMSQWRAESQVFR